MNSLPFSSNLIEMFSKFHPEDDHVPLLCNARVEAKDERMQSHEDRNWFSLSMTFEPDRTNRKVKKAKICGQKNQRVKGGQMLKKKTPFWYNLC